MQEGLECEYHREEEPVDESEIGSEGGNGGVAGVGWPGVEAMDSGNDLSVSWNDASVSYRDP